MRRLTLALVLLSLAACSASDDPASDALSHADTTSRDDGPPPDLGTDLPTGPPVTLSIATFNVQNFFDAYDDPEKDDDTPNAAQVQAKREAIGAAVRALDADIIALQEVENLALLQQLVSEELGGRGYDHVQLLEGNDPRGINVALLSRFAVLAVTSHASDRFSGTISGDSERYRFSRDCLEVVVEPKAGRRLVLLINHLRAADPRDPELALRTRQAQARRVREIVDSTLKWEPNAYLTVLGDLNDAPNSLTLDEITAGNPDLIDPFAEQAIESNYTNIYQGDKSRLDYILLSPALARNIATATALHDGVFSGVSDHFPARVTLTIR